MTLWVGVPYDKLTELLENVNLLGEIAYFGERVDVKEGINLIKTSAQILSQIKRNV